MGRKRNQESSPSPARTVTDPSPAHKKIRISEGLVQDNTDEGGEWEKVEKRKGKKAKKREAMTQVNPPKFAYSKGEIIKRRDAVGINDVRDLVLHLVADAPPPSWVRVENQRSIPKVVALLIPGMTNSVLGIAPLPTSATSNPNIPLVIPPLSSKSDSESSSKLPFISSRFSHACPTKAPGDATRMHSVLGEFFHGPVTGEEKRRRFDERKTSEKKLAKSPQNYLLSLSQMIENDYPIPSYMADVFQKPDGWVETPESVNSENAEPKVLAIDCEMCATEDGRELARVCIIDYATGTVVYDQLAKPGKPVIDYLTRWSGITAEALAPVTTTFKEVQDHVLLMLSAKPTPILLGHSLESDLKTLKICHPRCIDTAVMFHHPRGRPFKPALAWLTKKWCGRVIQARGEGGHDPEEDARACMELLQKKIQHGPSYGEFKTDFESIFERMSRSVGRGGPGFIRSAVVDHGNPAVMHGAKANTTVPCASDADVFEGLVQTIPSHQFVFGRFNALADALGWITPRQEQGFTPYTSTATTEPPKAPPTSSPDLSVVLNDLNDRLTRLYEALPPRTALVIFTGHSDPRAMSALNARKSAFETGLKSGKNLEELGKENWWTNQHGRELEEEVEKAKRGLLFLGIKGA